MEHVTTAAALAARGVRATIDFNGPLNALSTSPNNRFIAVGGRDVLKVVALETTGFTEKRNLRVGKSSLNFSTNDIRWHPHSDSLLATAATNGAVVIWNLQREGFKHVQERVLNGHRRAVNRICWHTTDWNVLISGSQDGTIKIWDKRGKVTNTYQPKSESVRDVRMSPFDPHRFAVAFENGIVQVWDIRKNAQPQLKFTAHKGLVLALDWHPTRPNLLASGGRDRYVKIWDLDDLKQPRQTVQTIASVGRVVWRPNCPDHVATSASLMDNSIHVWDVQRPFIPIASLKGHTDIASGIAWMDTPTSPSFGNPDVASEWEGHNYWQHMLACSKDGTLKLHALADAFKPHQSLPTTALALNSKGQMAFSHDVVDRTCASLKIHRYYSPASSLFNVTPGTNGAERRVTASSSFGSLGSDKLDDAADPSSTRTAARALTNAQPSAPPLPPKAAGTRMSSSSGNLSVLVGGNSSSLTATTSSSAGAASGSGAGIVRHMVGSASHHNLQSLHSGGGSGSNLAGPGNDSVLDNRRALHYANQPSWTTSTGVGGSGSATSSPALTFLPRSAAAVAPQALVALVSMQSAAKARELERILHGDAAAFARTAAQLEHAQAQFACSAQLTAAFGFDERAFRFLARQYVLFRSGKVQRYSDDDSVDGSASRRATDSDSAELSFAHMCAHNALAAFVTGNAHVSQMWRVLQVLYGHDDDMSAAAADADAETVDNTRKYYAPQHQHQHQHQHQQQQQQHHHHHQHHYLVETRSEDSTSVLSMDTDDHSNHNDAGVGVGLSARRGNKHTDDDFGHHQHQHHHPHHQHQQHGGTAANPNQTTMLLEQLDHVNPQALQGFDPYPYDVAGRDGDRSALTGGSSGVGTSGGTSNGNSSTPGGARKSNDPSGLAANGAASPMIVHGNAVRGELSHVRDGVLKELLEYYADIGDLQTCVAVAAVVSTVANVEQVMGKAWLQQIYMHYIDLLHQLRIYSAANELVANCSDQSIRQMNMKSTSVYFNCASCAKPFESYAPNSSGATGDSAPAALCSHCRNRATRCSICQLPVRGLYVWCPVCSHGGHLEHLAEWFAHDDVCPTGCSHRCALRLVGTTDMSDDQP